MRVLFVEDDPRVGRVYLRLGDLRGYRCLLATNLEEAAVAWRALRPDVIVFDGDLPDGRWADLVETARPALPETRLVLVTGAKLPARETVLLAPGDLRFVKPVSLARLASAVEDASTTGHQTLPELRASGT